MRDNNAWESPHNDTKKDHNQHKMIKESSKDRVLDKILQNYILQEDMSKPVDSDNFVTSFQIRKT